jgi:hypothetical protein
MSLVTMNSTVFTTLEKATDLPQVELDHAASLSTMVQGEAIGDLQVLQLSASLIRVSQVVREWYWDGPFPSGVDSIFELQVSGSSIGPVGTLTELLDAINTGVANGGLNQVRILHNGTEVLSLSMGASGYVLASGAQSVRIDGDLPLSFTELFELGSLFSDLYNIFYLSRVERNALFNQLDAFSLGGFAVLDGGEELFGIHVSATEASLTLNGMTIALSGTFPDRLGEGVRLLWEVSRQFENMFETGAGIDLTLLSNFDVTGLTITNDQGRVLATMPTPLDGTDMVWKVDGRLYAEMLMGDIGRDYLSGTPGVVKSVLAGMAGNDRLFGGAAADLLLGGSGADRLDGGSGTDRLSGGTGRDVLTGGGQADTFIFNPRGGLDTIRDFTEGLDLIQIASAKSLSDLTFTDLGDDVQIDFATVHIIVENIEIVDLAVAGNFVF